MKRAMKEFYKGAFTKEVLITTLVLYAGAAIGTWIGR